MSALPPEGRISLSPEQADEVLAALGDCRMGASDQARFRQASQEGTSPCYQYAAEIGGGSERLILLPDLTLLQPAGRPQLEPLLAATRTRLDELRRRFGLVPCLGSSGPRERLSGLAERSR